MSNNYKPLAGVKVVELSTMMAAPSCGRYLSDWGAEVIKIESKKGDNYRNYPPTMGIPNAQDCNPLYDNVNAGKRGIVLDIKTPEGMEAMHKLLARADVFLTNNRPKALAKMGWTTIPSRKSIPDSSWPRSLPTDSRGPRPTSRARTP